jgi:DNA-binding NarL/FixJ family response regulator
LQGAGCSSKVIFLTVHTDPDFIRTCLATGAFGYIFKERVDIDLMPAIREAVAGHLFISPSDSTRTS